MADSQAVFVHKMKHLKAQGTAIIMSCHERYLVEELSDTTYEVTNKQIKVTDLKSLATTPKHYRLIFLGDEKLPLSALNFEPSRQGNVLNITVEERETNAVIVEMIGQGWVLRGCTMRKIVSLLNYHLVIFSRSAKGLIPFGLLVILQISIYRAIQAHPVNFDRAAIQGEFFIFMIGIWLGFSSNTWHDPITEQLLALRVKSLRDYHVIYVIFLAILSLFAAMITTVIPIAYHVVLPEFFARYGISEFIASFFLFWSSSFTGMALGALSHPRFFKDRASCLWTIVLVSILTMTRTAVSTDFPWARFILWVFPNFSSHYQILSDTIYFPLVTTTSLVLVTFIYGLVCSAIKIERLAKGKY